MGANAMNRSNTAESTLTDRYQTTIPSFVRHALGLSKRDTIQYRINADGSVLMARMDQVDVDTAMLKFLDFLETDITRHPEGIVRLDANLLDHIDSLTASVTVNLESVLNDAD